MGTKELKNSSRRLIGYLKDSYGQTIYEFCDEKHATIGYLKEIQTRVKYEILDKSRRAVGYAEYFNNKLELKDKSRRTITKLSPDDIKTDAVILAIYSQYFQIK